jgi:hypothetical protein
MLELTTATPSMHAILASFREAEQKPPNNFLLTLESEVLQIMPDKSAQNQSASPQQETPKGGEINKPRKAITIPLVVARDVVAFKIEDTPDEVIQALMREVGDVG